MEGVVQLGLLALFVAIVIALLRPRYRFVIRIRDGHTQVVRGTPPVAFVDTVADVCRDEGIANGWVAGRSRFRQIVLAFDRRFPLGSRQRLRNAWANIR